jgi:ketosteroid isomerase-like protein
MKRLFIVAPLLILLGACGQNAPSTDTTSLEAASDAWEAALNAGDVDAIANFYTADARLGGTTTIVEANVVGDVGYIVGTFELQADGKAAGSGKYIETWQRGADGQWLITNDVFNNDPSPAPKMEKTHVMITHSVDDADHWSAAWSGEDSRKQLFKENGAAHVHAFSSADNPNLTGLVIAVNDMDALGAMLASEEGQAAAAEDGVRMDTMIMMTEVE